MMLKFIGLIKLILILSCLSNIEGREECVGDFIEWKKKKKAWNVWFCLNLYRFLFGWLVFDPYEYHMDM